MTLEIKYICACMNQRISQRSKMIPDVEIQFIHIRIGMK